MQGLCGSLVDFRYHHVLFNVCIYIFIEYVVSLFYLGPLYSCNLQNVLSFDPFYILKKSYGITCGKPAIPTNSNQTYKDANKYKTTCNTRLKS